MNTIGRLFTLTTFGESHGPYVGGVLDGVPSGLTLDMELIRSMIERRQGRGGVTTERKENDQPDFISGLVDGVTTGAPIAFLIPNENKRSQDYNNLREVFRPSHSDYTYYMKYGVRDHRGGGRSSARETVVRVVAGAIACQILQTVGIAITAYTTQVGEIRLPHLYAESYDREVIHNDPVGSPDPSVGAEMLRSLQEARANGDSLGGIAAVSIVGLPAGLGNPIYNKISATLASAIMSINAVKGIEFGDGFALGSMRGSEANDQFASNNGSLYTLTNHSGGIQGGITNGEELRFRVVFKPLSSIAMTQTGGKADGTTTDLKIEGRHDASVFPRVLPILEAMTALVVLDEYLETVARDHILRSKIDSLKGASDTRHRD